jgi:hypothetical protein
MIDYKALHSPTCCYFKGDLYVAFYAGERECINQSVFVFKKDKRGKFSLFYKMKEGTGNPVLFTVNDHLYCAYSVFTRPFINNVFDLWRTTYTSILNLSEEVIDEDKAILLSTYCCPRVNPYYFQDGSVLLPCYDEEIKRGVMFHIGKSKFITRGIQLSKHPVIQPSIYFQNGFKVLYRNFQHPRPKNQSFAPYGKIALSNAQNRILFSDTEYSTIPNNNESLIAFNDDSGETYVVYNAKEGREDLTLARLVENELGQPTPEPLLKLNTEKKASYPNWSYNNKGQLVIVYTSYGETGGGINSGSKIAIATVSKNYKKVLNTKFLEPKDLN